MTISKNIIKRHRIGMSTLISEQSYYYQDVDKRPISIRPIFGGIL